MRVTPPIETLEDKVFEAWYETIMPLIAAFNSSLSSSLNLISSL